MLCSKVVTVLVIYAVVLVNGMPQSEGSSGQDSSAGLPFIQFTNGGIRFNFGGYHAEAGLGGLLGGGRTGGGLHASAGTPWGAHAAAGLGGLLGGNNANAGGGLYARAGLGEGRHEAAAGLGGLLDGSGRSAPAKGGLFAGATTGARGVGVSVGSPSDIPSSGDVPNQANNTQNGGGGDAESQKASKGRTNIQIISRKRLEKTKQVANGPAESTEAPKPTDSPAGKEVRDTQYAKPVPVANAELFGAISVNPAPPAPLTSSFAIEKTKIISDRIEPAPPVPLLPSEANEVIDHHYHHRARIVRPHLRKRLWAPRKQIIIDYVPSADAEGAVHSNIKKRQATYRINGVPASQNYQPATPNQDNSLFDDIFKIPISTLNAVNQLLNNNSG